MRIVIIGAGLGGLTAAIRLVQAGHQVEVIEARDTAGGLASGFDIEGVPFDAGPYILFDRPGLEWVYQQLEISIDELNLQRIEEVYQVVQQNGPTVGVFHSLDRTIEEFETHWPGCGEKYREFVQKTGEIYRRLAPLQRISRPGLLSLIQTGAWRDVPFLIRPLESILNQTGLPRPLLNVIGVWTRSAGLRFEEAPSPMSAISHIIHQVGAWVPSGGMRAIAAHIEQTANDLGVKFRFRSKVRQIVCRGTEVAGVELTTGETISTDIVVANAAGVGTYLELLASGNVVPDRFRNRLERLPLQSPGVGVYLAHRGTTNSHFVTFHVDNDDCRILVTPSVAIDSPDKWKPARLIALMNHEIQQEIGEAGQREFLEGVLSEHWWKPRFTDHRVLETRIPAEWGPKYHLYQNSMNPVMTARQMREGRLAHRSPYVKGLYLAGSATHPGQWVSFCAISGVLAADLVRRDIG